MRLFSATADEYYAHATWEYPLPIRAVFRFVALVLLVFSRVMWRARLEGAHALTASGSTGSVIICNHTSMAEVVAIWSSLRCAGRSPRPIAKSEFYQNSLVAWAFSRAGAIPVARGTADLKTVRAAQHALQRGEDILIFPEGTRVRTDDQPVTIHGGFALMASMGKAPVVPMAVCGFRDVTPAGKHLMRPVRCWMRAGEAVSAADAPSGLKRGERLQWVEDEAVRRMYALRDELRAEHPGRF